MRADAAWPMAVPVLCTGRAPSGQAEADAEREAEDRSAALRAVAGSATSRDDFLELCQILGLDPASDLRGPARTIRAEHV